MLLARGSGGANEMALAYKADLIRRGMVQDVLGCCAQWILDQRREEDPLF
jgi:hypothetical protein